MHEERQSKYKLIHKPVVVGTYAIYRGKKVAQDQTYAWCCYVRGKEGEDLSKFVSAVEFELDPSFPKPIYNLLKPPFEVHEVGWGQFTIGIKIFFKDSSLKPVETLKELVLFDDSQPTTKRPIVTEEYNELIFIDPSPMMVKHLTQQNPPNAVQPPNTDAEAQKADSKPDEKQEDEEMKIEVDKKE